MATDRSHDLFDFMRERGVEMAAEYQRIQKRATDDPGTAGDQGEENWAELLRDWLPSIYEVVTKGRIISEQGEASPQVDVLVLTAGYPKGLLNKKLYLAAGVAAAFECKTTLRASHIKEAVANCIDIKSLYPARSGTPYRELYAPLVYGLLAHSHSWKAARSTPAQNIEAQLDKFDRGLVTHPRMQLDLICVADLSAWRSTAMSFVGPPPGKSVDIFGLPGSAQTAYLSDTVHGQPLSGDSTPVGVLVSYLTQRLAWEEPSLQSLADYYRAVNVAGNGGGLLRAWPTSIYSDAVREVLQSRHELPGDPWNQWGFTFPW